MKKIKVGDKIKMYVPHLGFMEQYLCHFEAILDDPTDNHNEAKQYVFRVYLKHKKYWKWYAEPYWHIALCNKWESELLNE